jgi:hypothetical protein
MEFKRISKYDIHIRHTVNGGIIVKVGCAELSFSSPEHMLEIMKQYYENPLEIMKQYYENPDETERKYNKAMANEVPQEGGYAEEADRQEPDPTAGISFSSETRR